MSGIEKHVLKLLLYVTYPASGRCCRKEPVFCLNTHPSQHKHVSIFVKSNQKNEKDKNLVLDHYIAVLSIYAIIRDPTFTGNTRIGTNYK